MVNKRKKPEEISEEMIKDVSLIKNEVVDSGDDVDEIRDHVELIKKEVVDAGDDVDEIRDDVSLIKKEVVDAGDDVDEIKKEVQKLGKEIRKSPLSRLKSAMPSKFAFADFAQQLVGAVILSSPFLVTEEVWNLAREIDTPRVVLLILITVVFDVLLYYFTKYRKTEMVWFGIFPLRIISLLVVTYTISAIMLSVFGVIGNHVTDPTWAMKLIVLVGLFANIGAGTADLIR